MVQASFDKQPAARCTRRRPIGRATPGVARPGRRASDSRRPCPVVAGPAGRGGRRCSRNGCVANPARDIAAATIDPDRRAAPAEAPGKDRRAANKRTAAGRKETATADRTPAARAVRKRDRPDRTAGCRYSRTGRPVPAHSRKPCRSRRRWRARLAGRLLTKTFSIEFSLLVFFIKGQEPTRRRESVVTIRIHTLHAIRLRTRQARAPARSA
jgi:hypothetical protein